MMDIVDRIDEVTAPVCGWCSTPLSSDDASLDFCTEECHSRWHAERSERLSDPREADRGFFADASVVWRDPWIPTAQIILEMNRPLREAMERNSARFARALATPMQLLAGTWPEDEAEDSRLADLLLREPSLADRMEAALEARRNRNTGPRQQPRAPRRIDARRSR